MTVLSCRFEAVIFDNDGVLVDSETLVNAILAEALTDIGLPTTMEEVMARYVGKAWVHCLEDIRDRMAPRPLPDGFLESVYDECDRRLEAELEPIPGTPQLLARLSDHAVPIAVATNSGYRGLNNALRFTGLDHHFPEDLRFSGPDLGRPKPDPHIYIEAIKAVGARADRAAIIEDSFTGLQAATATGATVFALCHTEATKGHAEDLGAIPCAHMDEIHDHIFS